jgi:hypothetical protein
MFSCDRDTHTQAWSERKERYLACSRGGRSLKEVCLTILTARVPPEGALASVMVLKPLCPMVAPRILACDGVF